MITDEQEHTSVTLQHALRGGLVTTPELAVKLAELLIAGAYDERELERQKPLTAIDQGDRWRIEGSRNPDRKDRGRARVVILKRNAQVLDLAVEGVWKLSPEDKETVKQALAQSRTPLERKP